MSLKIQPYAYLLAGTILISSCTPTKDQKAAVDPLEINYVIRSVWPHDTEAFTQGLLIHKGELYESTGQNGSSWIGIVDINTGVATKKVTLDERYFGEGIAILNNKIYQLTYTTKVGFVYSLPDFKKLKEWTYESQGWGLTHDNVNLIMSDGSNKLHYLDTTTQQIIKSVAVTDEQGAVKNLNELEFIEGYIYANVWQTNKIVKIDPATGKVVGRFDLSALANDARKASPQVDVLNGIAWHPDTRSFLVTGKHWPHVYILKIDAAPKPVN